MEAIMLSLYLSFTLFSLLASITPGPTNILALSNGSRMGISATVPFAIGAAGATAFILFLAATGLAKVFISYPQFKQVTALLGTLWLSYIAWCLYKTAALSAADLKQQLSWREGAGMQFINPKSWMMAITATSLFSSEALSLYQHSTLLALIFFLVTCPCITCWAALGKLIHSQTTHKSSQQYVNRILAIVLFATVWWLYYTVVFSM
ncbi:MAG: threonine/homoserine/homoserine lactone efflux protein [Oceanospirillaceae bacterium]|jgi:threonine/homoserine/homoserine lactone efflux protein